MSYQAKRKGVGKEHVKKEKRKLASVDGEGCDGYSTLTFERKPLIVPACPASGLMGCSIIDIEYYVEVGTLVKIVNVIMAGYIK